MKITEIKKANGEIMRIIDGEYVIGAGSGCFASPKPYRKTIKGEFLVERNYVDNNENCVDYYEWIMQGDNITKVLSYGSPSRDGNKLYVPKSASIYINMHPGSNVSYVIQNGNIYIYYDLNMVTNKIEAKLSFSVSNVVKVEITNKYNHFASMVLAWICIPEQSYHFSPCDGCEIIGI